MADIADRCLGHPCSYHMVKYPERLREAKVFHEFARQIAEDIERIPDEIMERVYAKYVELHGSTLTRQ